jgi:hypothetical protein
MLGSQLDVGFSVVLGFRLDVRFSVGCLIFGWMLDVGCWMLDVGCWVLGVGCLVLGVWCCIQFRSRDTLATTEYIII